MYKKCLYSLIIIASALMFNACAYDFRAMTNNNENASVFTTENSEYDFDELIPSRLQTIDGFENVEMISEKDSVSSTGIELIIINETNSELIYGSYYRLEVNSNDTWYEVPVTVEGEYAFTSIGYIIAPGTRQNFRTDWEWLYGRLRAGNYRIIKDVLDFRGTGDYDKYYLLAEFVIR